MQQRTPPSTVGAAVLLAILTLSVFLVSRGRGPQSTLVRYHEALAEGRRELLPAFYPAPRDQAALVLETEIRGLVLTSSRISVGRVVTRGNQAVADVIYDSQAAGLRPIRFVFQRVSEGWLINAGETLAQSRESSIF